MAGNNIIKIKSYYFLTIFLMLALALGTLTPAALAADYLTATVAVDGNRVSAAGTTTPDTDVTLLVIRTTDENKSYTDQTRSDETGAFSFCFQMEEGTYQATFTSNGLTVQREFTVKNTSAGTVTVRVEGAEENLLPETKVDILAGQTTLLEAVTKALDESGTPYEMQNGMIYSIRGEEGWQWLLNGKGGMALPSTLLQDGDEIVLVDDMLWDPILTRLTLSDEQVSVGDTFTVTLEKVVEKSASPASGQEIYFNNESKITDAQGKVEFTATAEGNYYVTAQTKGNLVRPVPASIRVGKTSIIPDRNIRVKIRIEGYKKTIFNDTVTFDPESYKSSDGKYRITDPDGEEHKFSRPTVLLATIVAWNEGHIKDNSIGYNDNYVARMAGEEEFDFKDEHPTCGWLVRVNDVLINQGAGVWPIEDGDTVEWYYGDLDSYFGEIEVSPTSLDPGGTIKVKVTGRSNKEKDFGRYGERRPMADATVYVDGREYTTDENGEAQITMNTPGTYEVYAIKLDKNSKNGNYYFPLMSRTEKIEVKVTGTASSSIVLPEEIEGETFAELQKLLNKAGIMELPKERIKVEAGKAVVHPQVSDIEKAIAQIDQLVQEIKEKNLLEEEDVQWLKTKIRLVVPQCNCEEMETIIDTEAAKLLAQIDSLEVMSEIASFEVTAQTFGKEAKGQEIILFARRVDSTELSEKERAAVPQNSSVTELEARLGGNTVSNFNEPMLVGIPYADNSEAGDQIAAFMLNQDGTVEPVGGLYDEDSEMVKFITNHFSRYFAKQSVKQFADLSQVSWAKDAVQNLAGKGIIRGKSDSLFDPTASITRAEFCALMTRMLKYEASSDTVMPFKDVAKGIWYYDAVLAAYEKGLVSGKSAEAFDPSGAITRQEMAKIIGKVLESRRYRPGEEKQLDAFKDKDSIASWAKDAAAVVAREGIITGTPEGNFEPNRHASRAETAVMLFRLYKLIMK
ncbi:MAG: hypothetical protein PWQ97_383 [Tepidanaerobacteraceae bacterium]|nr:hypothetical protein [Tepidanaerobacteraceae bacterium]